MIKTIDASSMFVPLEDRPGGNAPAAAPENRPEPPQRQARRRVPASPPAIDPGTDLDRLLPRPGRASLPKASLLISRSEAMALGLTYYRVATPCPHGHVGNRLVSNLSCVECVKSYNQTYYATHSAELVARVQAWRKANPEALRAQRRRRQVKLRLLKQQSKGVNPNGC
jgi:hypothetical protein